MTEPANSRIFVSYSWDSESHRKWIKKVAISLREKGINALIDQWELAPGDQLPAFMESAVRDSQYVLIVCTEKYKYKSDHRQGGVGYEGDIMTAQVLSGGNRRKFIPLLRAGDSSTAIPTWLQGSVYIDLRKGPTYRSNLNALIRTLLDEREKAPALNLSGHLDELALGSIATLQERIIHSLNTQKQKNLINEAICTYLVDFWHQMVPGYSLNEAGKDGLKKLLCTYDSDMIMKAMMTSVAQYCVTDISIDTPSSGRFTSESVNKAWNYVARICFAERQSETKPYYRDILMIRGILRKRLSYLKESDALELLENAAMKGVPIESLRRLANGTRSWSSWLDSMLDLVGNLPGQQNGA